MDAEQIEYEKQKVVKMFGKWTAHNIHLGEGVYTIGKDLQGDEIKLWRIVQIITDLSNGLLHNLRILDLACLEGLYGIELARHGAQVVGIEGRESNLEKAQLSKRILNLDNITIYKDDVRNLNVAKYGHFDVVLCLGILYHLDAPDVFTFLENILSVAQKFVIIDTHVSLSADRVYTYKEKKYWGETYVEHPPIATAAEKEKELWASIDNPLSFWLTRNSLFNCLSHFGFTSVYECQIPEEVEKAIDRFTFVAMKGERAQLKVCPQLPPLYHRDLPDKLSTFWRRARNLIYQKLKIFAKWVRYKRHGN